MYYPILLSGSKYILIKEITTIFDPSNDFFRFIKLLVDFQSIFITLSVTLFHMHFIIINVLSNCLYIENVMLVCIL